MSSVNPLREIILRVKLLCPHVNPKDQGQRSERPPPVCSTVSLRLIRLVLVSAAVGQFSPQSSGWYQDLWELEESSRGDVESTLGKGTERGPFSREGN